MWRILKRIINFIIFIILNFIDFGFNFFKRRTKSVLQNIQQEKEIKYSWHAHKTSSTSSLLEDLFSDMTCEDARRNREDVIKNARQFQKLATIVN